MGLQTKMVKEVCAPGVYNKNVRAVNALNKQQFCYLVTLVVAGLHDLGHNVLLWCISTECIHTYDEQKSPNEESALH